jgi:Family of unknown function (DUF6084)
MPDLRFRVDGVEPAPRSAEPALHFKLRVENVPADEAIESVLLECQIRIEATRRQYAADEQRDLRDLFGEPGGWSRTLRAMLWTHSHTNVPSFRGSTTVDLPVLCTFDLTIASAKYFHGLEDGAVPVTLLFSGTVFYSAGDGRLQIAQIPWSKEAAAEVPVRVWKEMMDRHYPNTGWLCLRRDVFDRLYRHKVACGLPTWEQTLESLLP